MIYIRQSEVGLGVFSPESDDTSISVGNHVRINVDGPDKGSVYQVQSCTIRVPPLPDLPVSGVIVCDSSRSFYPLTDVTRVDLIGEIQGSDIPVQKLKIRTEAGITMAIANRPDDEFDNDMLFPAPTEWMELEDVGNLKNIKFYGPVDKKVYLMWKIVD